MPRSLASLGPLVLALALPPLFVHVDYQPGVGFHAGSTEVHVFLSDFAVLAAGLAALAAGLRGGFAPLRRGVPVWLAAAGLLVLIAAATFYPLLRDGSYSWRTHLVTAGKFGEYAVLALAVPLLVRGRRDLSLLLLSLTAISVAATTVGVAQFFGWGWSGAWPAGRRQPSFVGHHDFAALSAVSLGIAVAAIAVPGWRINRLLAVVAGLAGTIGLVVSGSTAGAAGLAAGAAGAVVVARGRGWVSGVRVAGLAAVVAVVAGGVVALRGNDFDQFIRFLGVRRETASSRQNVQTYAQHTLLAYIGWRIFLDHPALGAGWQASGKEPSVYGRYLAAAHREFPEVSPLAFPSPQRQYGVQNAFVQALADLGVVGFLLLVGVFATGLVLAARTALRATAEAAGAAVTAGVWLLGAAGALSAIGLVAGIPTDAVLWLALGLVAAVPLDEPA